MFNDTGLDFDFRHPIENKSFETIKANENFVKNSATCLTSACGCRRA